MTSDLKKPESSATSLAVFRGKQVRRLWHDARWFFSVVDVVEVLTDSANPRDCWYRLKQRAQDSSEIELSTFCRQLKLTVIETMNNRGLAV